MGKLRTRVVSGLFVITQPVSGRRPRFWNYCPAWEKTGNDSVPALDTTLHLKQWLWPCPNCHRHSSGSLRHHLSALPISPCLCDWAGEESLALLDACDVCSTLPPGHCVPAISVGPHRSPWKYSLLFYSHFIILLTEEETVTEVVTKPPWSGRCINFLLL